MYQYNFHLLLIKKHLYSLFNKINTYSFASLHKKYNLLSNNIGKPIFAI